MAEERSIYDYVTDELREAFNDLCLREMGLDLTENDLVYDVESNTIMQFDGMYLRYCDSKYTIINEATDIRFDLIDNAKLMNILASWYCSKELAKRGYRVLGMNQYITNKNTYSGYLTLSIEGSMGTYNGTAIGRVNLQDIRSGEFINESVRLLSLVCTINGTAEMYDLKQLDAR